MKQRTVLSLILVVAFALLSTACGATPATATTAESVAPSAEKAFTLPSAQGLVVGYEAGEDQNVDGLLKACAETKMECVRGKDIATWCKRRGCHHFHSNQWHVYGAWPQIQNAKKAAIPISCWMPTAASRASTTFPPHTALSRRGWMDDEGNGRAG